MRRAAPAAALALVALASVSARAEDYVTLRGAYYREASTRVIQPVMEVERNSPSGLDVKASFLVDAITSASQAAGTAVDAVFTETRNETALMVRKRWSRLEASLSYKYSAESDYWSHVVGGGVSGRLWGDTARLGLSAAVTSDTVSSRFRTPYCATPPSTTCPLHSAYVGLSYTQVLAPDLIAQLSLETAYLEGFQANLYRSVPNFGFERLPGTRQRNAVAGRLAYLLPNGQTSLRVQYRYYFDFQPGEESAGDPWRLRSHTIEGRLYQPLSDTLDLRLSLRWYKQSGAQFFCDPIARPGCYPPSATSYSTDGKLGPMHSTYPEVKLVWLASAFEGVPVLEWLAAGSFEISYGRFFQSTSYGNAHLLQTGYTIPY